MFSSNNKYSLDAIKRMCIKKDTFKVIKVDSAELSDLKIKIKDDGVINTNSVFKLFVNNSKFGDSILYVLYNFDISDMFKKEYGISIFKDLEGLEANINFCKIDDLYVTVLDKIFLDNNKDVFVEGIIKAIEWDSNNSYLATIDIIPNEYKNISDYKGIREVIKNEKKLYSANINVANGSYYPILNSYTKLHFYKHNKTAASYDIILKKNEITVKHINIYENNNVEIIGHDLNVSNQYFKIMINFKDFIFHKYSFIKRMIVYPELDEVVINDTAIKAKVYSYEA